MRTILKIVTVLIITTASAMAACPATAPYSCVPMPSGKMLCGCGVR